MNLTAKQIEILKAIRRYRKQRGISPTLAEIAGRIGISKITVYEHVCLLVEKGALEKEKYKSRALTITRRAMRLLRELEREEERQEEAGERRPGEALPLLGTIAAGRPIEALEDKVEVELDELLRTERADYILKVRGQSMIEEGIREGDYVLVEKRSTARNGETVVAVVGDDNEATLKKYKKVGRKVHLVPANPTMKPIVCKQCEVRGVVVGILRRY